MMVGPFSEEGKGSKLPFLWAELQRNPEDYDETCILLVQTPSWIPVHPDTYVFDLSVTPGAPHSFPKTK